MIDKVALRVAGFALGVVWAVRERSLYHRIQNLRKIDYATYIKVIEASEVIEKSFEQFNEAELALAFNGGKDCLVVFRLVQAYCQRNRKSMPLLVYFEREDEFPEMIEFMMQTVRGYNLDIFFAAGGFKSGLEQLRSRGIKAVLMGQRRSDPYAPSTHFAPTTEGWPEIMRINPILDLPYSGVWCFLKGTGTKYCALYDDGYTSLGPKSKTIKNVRLSSGEFDKFRPAHELVEGDNDERQGRSS